MGTIFRSLLFFVLFAVCGLSGVAQDRQSADTTSKKNSKKNKNFVIVLNDGTEYIGEILNDDGREMLINVPKKGKIYIPKYVVASINPVTPENFKDNEYLNENHFPRYYMMGTNALPFKRKKFSANMFYFLSGSVNYDINESYSVGVTSTFWGSPLAVNAKSSFMISEKNYVGIDVHGGTIIYLSPGALFGHLAAKYTHGDGNSNFTFSAGLINYSLKQKTYIQNSNGFSSYSTATNSFVSYYLSAATAQRLTKTNIFVGEFLIFPNNNFALAGIGLRTSQKETSSFVFGFYNIIRLSPPTNGSSYPYNNNSWSNSNGFYYNNRTFPVLPIPYIGMSFKL